MSPINDMGYMGMNLFPYIVQPGDSLTIIANRFNTTVRAILDANIIDENLIIYPGQILFIPTDHDCRPPFMPLPPERRSIIYVIQPGDTLNAISRRFDTSVDAIRDLNNIQNVNEIYPGRIIMIPILELR
jgi:LysM repeat protein